MWSKTMFKHDEEFKEMGDNAHKATAEQIRAYIERFERLEAEKQDVMQGQKEIMSEAKGNGFNVKALRKIIADKKRDADDLAEEQALVELYKSALGI
jgi:uncharacterized protein (UPF0335 family)